MKRLVKILIIAAIVLLIIGPDKRRITMAVRRNSGSVFVELSEGFVEFEATGPMDGDPVVFIHGLSVPMYDWDRQFQALAEKGFRVIRYNQYGRGLSNRPWGTYDMDRYVRQLDELLESQGWDRATLIGHSMGGVVVAGFAEAHPEAVDRIVLISPGLFLGQDNSGIALVRIPILGDLAAKTLLANILASRADSLFVEAGVAEAEAYSQEFRQQTRYAGFSRSVKSLFRHDVVDDHTDTYKSLERFETLLIHGTQDMSVPQVHFDTIAAGPSVERVVLPGVGHMPNMEAPEKVNNLIVGFLGNK